MSAACLKFIGHIPSKKNGKFGWRGRVVINPDVSAAIRALETQAVIQWARKPPIDKTKFVYALFLVRDGRCDLDGKYTTLQDVLVKTGVIRNDSIARVPHVELEALIDANEQETAVVVIR